MQNLSWLLYRGYYEGFTDWNNLKSDDRKIKQGIEHFFTEKNKPFLTTEVTPVSGVKVQPVALSTTYPGLLTGSGYAHGAGATGEFKLGFYLDYTTGMPVIPGTSVKGALRSVFPQFQPPKGRPLWEIQNFTAEQNDMALAKAAYIANLFSLQETDPDECCRRVHELELTIFEGINVAESVQKKRTVYYSIYQRDIFLDAIPVGSENNHRKLFGTDAITPHIKAGKTYEEAMLTNPVPLLFLKVLPNVVYHFAFQCKAPVVQGVDADKRIAAFRTILLTFGIGAKTNVGYGQFAEKPTLPPPVRIPPNTGTKRTGQPDNYQRPTSYRLQEQAEQNRREHLEAEKKKQQEARPVNTRMEVPENAAWPELTKDMKGKLINATVQRASAGQLFLRLHLKNFREEKKTNGKASLGEEVSVMITNITGKEGSYGVEISPKIYPKTDR